MTNTNTRAGAVPQQGRAVHTPAAMLRSKGENNRDERAFAQAHNHQEGGQAGGERNEHSPREKGGTA
jgi:hypothetical protein